MIYIQFALLVGLVVFDAIGDATRDAKKKISHLFQALFVATALSLVIYYPGVTWIDHIWILILWYGVNRLFLFDLVWNITNGTVSLDYIGMTGWWDITITNILIKIRMSDGFWFWIKFCIWVAYTGAILTKYKL